MTNSSLETIVDIEIPKDCKDDGSISYSNSNMVYCIMKEEASRDPIKRLMAWFFYKMDESIAKKRVRDLEKKGYRHF